MLPSIYGPQPFSHQERLLHAGQIEASLRRHFGGDLLALGIYGSLSRKADGPYSDIEMHAILRGEGIDDSLEWSAGTWKAEVDLYSPEVFLKRAGEMDEFWPITHGAYARVEPLHDSIGIFPRAAQVVYDHSVEEIEDLIREVLVGDLYEVVGKARNALAMNRPTSLAAEAVDAARYCACLLGLATRTLFSTGPAALPEALRLPGRPRHLDEFFQLVIDGDLRDAHRVAAALDACWAGMETWAQERGLQLHRDFDDLLHGRQR